MRRVRKTFNDPSLAVADRELSWQTLTSSRTVSIKVNHSDVEEAAIHNHILHSLISHEGSHCHQLHAPTILFNWQV